ncbi:MAG: hypothetical protein WDO13_20240 [Verrucomicrobiota bacterium]
MQNRAIADEVGQWLPTLRPQITTILSKIDFSTVRPRLLFTQDIDKLKTIASQIEKEVADQKATNQSNEQTALDLNSILNEANSKFNDSYLREKNNWPDFDQFDGRFVSILNKIAAQADGKTLAQEHLQGSDDDRLLRGHRRRRDDLRERVLLAPRRQVAPRLRLHRQGGEGLRLALQQHDAEDPRLPHGSGGEVPRRDHRDSPASPRSIPTSRPSRTWTR